MYQWDDLEKTSEHKKWDEWVIRPARKSLPILNYSSAFVFALATFVEVYGIVV